MPAEGVAVAGVLGLEVLGAVLADDLDTRPLPAAPAGRRRRTSTAATIVTSGPSSERMRSRFERTVSADNAENALDSTGLSGPSVREEEVGVAGGAEVEAVDARAPRPRAVRARRRSRGRACPRAGGRARKRAGRARRRPLAPRSSRARPTARSPRPRARHRAPRRPWRRCPRAGPASRRAGPRARARGRSRARSRSAGSRRRSRAAAGRARRSRARRPPPRACPRAARWTSAVCLWRFIESASGSAPSSAQTQPPVLAARWPGRRRSSARG